MLDELVALNRATPGCPKCDRLMRVRYGEFGPFWACPASKRSDSHPTISFRKWPGPFVVETDGKGNSAADDEQNVEDDYAEGLDHGINPWGPDEGLGFLGLEW